MQKVRVPINSFQFGEISDSLKMRTDSPVYAQSAQDLQNMLVMSEGSVKKRHGLKYIYSYDITYNSTYPEQSHLFKFIFDENEEYIISVEHEKIRCFRLLTDGTISLVDTITSDVNGDDLPFDREYLQQYTYAQYGDVMFICHPLFAPRTLIRTSLTSFELSTFAFDFRSDETVTYQPYSKFQASRVYINPRASSGTNVKVALYTKTGTADTDGIALAQNDTASPFTVSLNGPLASNGTVTFDVAKEVTITDTSGATDDVFTIVGTDADGVAKTITYESTGNNTFYTGEYFKTITSITCSTSFSDVSIGVSDKEAAVGFFDITGSHSSYGNYTNSKHKGVVLRYGKAEMEIRHVQSSNQCKVDIVDELKVRLSILNPLRTTDGSDKIEVTHIGHGFAGGEAVTIEDASAVGGINASQINGSRTVSEIIDENTYTITAAATSNLSEDGGGLVKVVSHANTLNWDEQAWSAARGYPAAVTFHENRLCFGGTLAEPDVIWMSRVGSFFDFNEADAGDSDAITLTAATGEVNEIRYMISNRDLQIFTASGQLYVPTFQNQSITPTNAQIRKQTPYGTAFVAPQSIDGATVFAQQNGKIVREYLYSDKEDAYTATAISTIASHLVNNPKYLDVVHSGFSLPDSYAAIVLENGDLSLFSSNRAEQRAAWTKVTTAGDFAGVVSVDNRLFVNVWDENNKLQLCEFEGDVGLDLYLYKAVSNNVADVSDLYSEDDVVDVLGYDGTNIDSLGSFIVNTSDQVDLTGQASGYTHIYVGKKFTSKIQTNEIDASMGSGPATGSVRGVANIVVDFKETRSAKVNSRKLITSTAFTGKKEFRVLGYSRTPTITIEQDDPLPMQVNGIVAELVT